MKSVVVTMLILPASTVIDKGPEIWIKQHFCEPWRAKICFIHIEGPLSIKVAEGKDCVSLPNHKKRQFCSNLSS